MASVPCCHPCVCKPQPHTKVSPVGGCDLHPTMWDAWDDGTWRWVVLLQIPPMFASLVPGDCTCACLHGVFTAA